MPDKVDVREAEKRARVQKKWLFAADILDRAEFRPNAQDVTLTAIRVKMPEVQYGDTMIILKGQAGEDALVGFYRSDSTQNALVGALVKFHQGEIKWKADEYA